jgi:CRISPR/Cas system-associated protein Cas7 (RAMP superfamily)
VLAIQYQLNLWEFLLKRKKVPTDSRKKWLIKSKFQKFYIINVVFANQDQLDLCKFIPKRKEKVHMDSRKMWLIN